MGLLGEREIQAVKDKLGGIKNPVKVVLINPPKNIDLPNIPKNQYTETTEELFTEIANAVPEKVKLEILRYPEDEEKIAQYYLSKPYGYPLMTSIILLDHEGNDYGIRFYGIPAGYEFATILEDIIMLGNGDHGLNPRTVQELEKLPEGVRIWVFVTPSCPYCPRAARLAHQMAYASKNVIEGATIEAMEFEKLSQEWQVYGVPKIVIGLKENMGLGSFEGAVPEPVFVSHIKNAVSK